MTQRRRHETKMAANPKHLDPRALVGKGLQDIPTLPEIVLKVLEATENPNVTCSQIEGLLKSDEAIATKILKVVNSAYYGLSRPVGSISQGCVIIGFQQVRKLILGLSAVSLFKARSARMREALDDFWHHSCSAAVGASMIMQDKGFSPDVAETAYMAGLLHDIGQVFLAATLDVYYLEVLRRTEITKANIVDVERSLMKVDHLDVGRELSKAWNLPDWICEAITRHHGPLRLDDAPYLLAVHIGDQVPTATEEATFEDYLANTDPVARSWAGFDESAWSDYCLRTQETVLGMAEALGIG